MSNVFKMGKASEPRAGTPLPSSSAHLLLDRCLRKCGGVLTVLYLLRFL